MREAFGLVNTERCVSCQRMFDRAPYVMAAVETCQYYSQDAEGEKQTIFRASPSLWNRPCNILRRDLDITKLAVNAILVRKFQSAVRGTEERSVIPAS